MTADGFDLALRRNKSKLQLFLLDSVHVSLRGSAGCSSRDAQVAVCQRRRQFVPGKSYNHDVFQTIFMGGLLSPHWVLRCAAD